MSSNPTKEQLRVYLTADVLHDPAYPLTDGEALISSGLIDSFSLVDIALWVEETFGVHIDNSDLNADQFDTLDELTAYILEHQ
jgi:acyl carrier protein